jgi:hypothetical protein
MAAGKSMFELSKKLLGLEGSTVTLSMQRVTDNSTYSLTMVRKETFRKSGACSGGERSRRRIPPFALGRAPYVFVCVCVGLCQQRLKHSDLVHMPAAAARRNEPTRTRSVLHCQERGWEAWSNGTVPA